MSMSESEQEWQSTWSAVLKEKKGEGEGNRNNSSQLREQKEKEAGVWGLKLWIYSIILNGLDLFN